MAHISGNSTPRDKLDRVLAVLARTVRYWWVAAIAMGIGVAGSLGAATLKKREYRSEAVLLYREGIQSTFVLGRDTESEQTRKLGMRLREMVLARPRLKEVIDELKLYPQIVENIGYMEAIDLMRTAILFRVREGDTFLLAYTHTDPVMAQKVVERLSQILIEENTRYRSQQAQSTREFMVAEKERTLKDLKSKDRALATWAQAHPEFVNETTATAGAMGSSIRAAEKEKAKGPARSGIDAEIQSLQNQAERLRHRLDMPASARAAPTVVRDPRLVAAVDDAQRELASARREMASKASEVTDAHPDMIAAKRRVQSAERLLSEAQDNLRTGTTTIDAPPATAEERPALEARLRQVENELSDVRKRKAAGAGAAGKAAAQKASNLALEIVEQETEWARLNREVSEARERYNQVESREFAASMMASSEETGQVAQIEVVDPAFKPVKPFGGGRFKMFLMGMVASLGMAVAVVLACAVFDDRLYDSADVEQLELAPVLVTVPRLGKPRG
jgi:uncharacterized protein involved in exopolysaccharide biosynthesis